MKKLLSVILSAVMGASVLNILPVSAVDENSGGIVIFGDSIAAGYGLDKEKEYNYGQIIGDYLGCEVDNYAVSGDTTGDMLDVIADLSDEQKQNVSESDIIIVSIGGNDLLQYASKKILDFCAKRNLLNEGFTSSDIPEEPGISDLMLMVNLNGKGGLIEYAKSSPTAAMELNSLIKDIAGNCRFDNEKYEGYIANSIMPNIKTAVSEIKEINPDARIIVQTVYQPIQIDPEFIESEYGSDSTYADVIATLRINFRNILDTFRTELSAVEGIEIADVYYEFTSLDDSVTQNASNPGYAYYFTNIQKSGKEKDFHPNQRGHLAIASKILDVIGELHDDNGLLTKVYLDLDDIGKDIRYPHIALDTYKKVAGNFITGDINFDGKIDASDATVALRDYTLRGSFMPTILSGYQQTAANVNSDEYIDSSDATIILRYYTLASSGDTRTMDEFLLDLKNGSDS